MILTIIIFTLCGISFVIGSKWGANKIQNVQAYKLKADISVQMSTEDIGKLPKGTQLHEYRSMGETTTYVVFLNLKDNTILEPLDNQREFKMWALDGYTQ